MADVRILPAEDGTGRWVVDEGRGTPQQLFNSVTVSRVSGIAENASEYVLYTNVTVTNNHDGTATVTGA